jgi:hypothetical protein
VEAYSKENLSSFKRIGELLGYFQPASGSDGEQQYTLSATMRLPNDIRQLIEWGPQGLYEITPKLIRQAKNMHEQLNHLAHLIYPELKFEVSIAIDAPE